MDASRISSGRVELQLEDIAVGDAVHKQCRVSSSYVRCAWSRTYLDRSTGADLVRADAVRLEQILVNLLANAAKYTEPGG